MSIRGMRNKKLGTYSKLATAVGRVRYKGGTSHAPTVGAVDKGGYAERDRKSAIKKYLLKKRSK